MRTAWQFMTVAAFVALGAGCANSFGRGKDPNYDAEARAELIRLGYRSSDIKSLTLVEEKRSNQEFIVDHHVWARLNNCIGWVVVRIDDFGVTGDTYATGHCHLPRPPAS